MKSKEEIRAHVEEHWEYTEKIILDMLKLVKTGYIESGIHQYGHGKRGDQEMTDPWAEKPEPVWVPRGYYSMSKIKEDDVQMFILEDMDAWLEELKAHYDEAIPRLESDYDYVENENQKLFDENQDLKRKLEAVRKWHEDVEMDPDDRYRLEKILEIEE